MHVPTEGNVEIILFAMKFLVGKKVYTAFPENNSGRPCHDFGMKKKMIFLIQYKTELFYFIVGPSAVGLVIEDIVFWVARQIIFGKGDVGDSTAVVPNVIGIENAAPKERTVYGSFADSPMDP